MKKIGFVLIILSLFLALASCGNDYYEIIEKEKVDTVLSSEGTTEYIVNKATGSYHLSSCYIVNNIKEENKIATTDIEFLIEREYTPCKKCIDK